MTCPYCKVLRISMTVEDEHGQYSMCFPCAFRWGLKQHRYASVVSADMETRILESLWQEESAEVDR